MKAIHGVQRRLRYIFPSAFNLPPPLPLHKIPSPPTQHRWLRVTWHVTDHQTAAAYLYKTDLIAISVYIVQHINQVAATYK